MVIAKKAGCKTTVEESNENEFQIHSNRIRKILRETIRKLKIFANLPALIRDDGEVLRQYLTTLEADFVLAVCSRLSQTHVDLTPPLTTSGLSPITNPLQKISFYEKQQDIEDVSEEASNAYMSQAIDIVLNNNNLVEFLQNLEDAIEPPVSTFIDSFVQLQEIVETKLNTSGKEEKQREDELKAAYRSNIILTQNVRDLEEELEKQRAELRKEHDKKSEALEGLTEKVESLRNKFRLDVNQIVYDSEKLMMQRHVVSECRQIELAEQAKQTVQQFEQLLDDHLQLEKSWRAKTYKTETQLASWLTKYDADIGEKQTELEELQKTFDAEKEEFDVLQEKFDDQEEEYVVLMKEKEDEERRIYEEKAYEYLLNRSARRIQRCWRAYWLRKMARKKARKCAKKRGGSAGGKKGGSKKGGSASTQKSTAKSKDKKKEQSTTLRGGPDPNAIIESKFNKELLEDIKAEDTFAQKNVVVNLEED